MMSVYSSHACLNTNPTYRHVTQVPASGGPAATCIPVDRRDITLTELLSEGAVGRLYRGTLGRQQCLLKTVTAQAGQQQSSRLLAEGRLLAGCCHPALLPVLGCTADGGPPCVLYPDLGTMSLKRFLGSCRAEGETGGGRELRQQTMVDMVVQVLSGLVHLHSRGILHRDVAARNCV